MLHQWMEAIFGQPTLPLADDPAAQTRLLELLRARYLDIQLRTATPRSQITTDNLFTPLHADVDPGDCICAPTSSTRTACAGATGRSGTGAQGFRTAVSEDLSWDELIEDPDDHLISPIVLFDLGHNPDRPEQQIDQDDAFAQLLITTLYELMAWWRDLPTAGPCGSSWPVCRCCANRSRSAATTPAPAVARSTRSATD